jgi:hypothetical protein
MTAVLSSQEHGLTGHPYAGFDSIREALENGGMTKRADILEKLHTPYPANYYDDKLLNAAIESTKGTETCGSELVYHGGNDQGLVDYIRASFWLFGANTYSLYYFYFVTLLLSIVAYLVAFRRSYMACVFLFAGVCAIYPFLSTYLHSDPELITVATPRFLGTLGIVPLLHLSMQIVVGPDRLTWPSLLSLVVQSMMIAFVIMIRSSMIWMIVSIGLLTLYYLPIRHWVTAGRPAAILQFFAGRGLVALVYAATFLTVGVVQGAVLTPSSNTALNAHTTWHNIFEGLEFSPDWKQRFAALYDNAEDDGIPFTAAKKYVEQHALPYVTEPSIWVASPAVGDEPSIPMPLGSWKTYDVIVRLAFLEFAGQHPRFVIENFFYYKPLLLVRSLSNFFRLAWLDIVGVKLVILLFMVAAIAAFARVRPDSDLDDKPGVAQLLLLTVTLLAVSLVPIFLAYGTSFLIVDAAFLSTMVIVLAGFGALLFVFRVLRPGVR